MKKRTLVIIFAILMAAVFIVACGDDSEPHDSSIGSEFSDQTEDTRETIATETASTETASTETASTDAATVSTTVAVTEESTDETELIFNWVIVKLSQVGETAVIYSGPIDGKDIRWSTDDDTVATVVDGVVTAVGNGKTKVHGEYGGVWKSCTVQCNIVEETVPETTVPADPSAPVLALPEYQSVSSSFFDDALFIGDSVSEGLNNYCTYYGGLGNANFATKVSYGVANEISGTLRVNLFGTPTRIEQIVAHYNPGKIFIMLGINELGYGQDTIMSYWGTYLSRIRSVAPDAQIYIQSVLPVYTNGQNFSNGVTNSNAESLNARLREFALNNGCIYLDVAAYMKDSTGGLVRAYTSDRYVHLSNDGIRAWIQVLYAIVG